MPANIFTERVVWLVFGLKKKRTDTKHILFIDASNISKEKKPYCKEDIEKNQYFSKIVPKINTATLQKWKPTITTWIFLVM
jgi:hypothetical protein